VAEIRYGKIIQLENEINDLKEKIEKKDPAALSSVKKLSRKI
jgi:hypothetical protein